MGHDDTARQSLIDGYRRRAAHYDLTSRLSPVPGYPQQAHRARAVDAMRLRPGDCVVDVACGTGLDFPLIERRIGPVGRLVGVDLSGDMLAQARRRVEACGWRNVTLVHADAADYAFPARVDGILATYPHALLPDPARVISQGSTALAAEGRWAVLDVKIPDHAPPWLVGLAVTVAGRGTGLGGWASRRPWESLHDAMRGTLRDVTWTELFFGVAYLVTGSPRVGDNPARDTRQTPGATE